MVRKEEKNLVTKGKVDTNIFFTEICSVAIFNVPKPNEIFSNSNQYASDFETVYINCLHSTNFVTI